MNYSNFWSQVSKFISWCESILRCDTKSIWLSVSDTEQCNAREGRDLDNESVWGWNSFGQSQFRSSKIQKTWSRFKVRTETSWELDGKHKGRSHLAFKMQHLYKGIPGILHKYKHRRWKIIFLPWNHDLMTSSSEIIHCHPRISDSIYFHCSISEHVFACSNRQNCIRSSLFGNVWFVILSFFIFYFWIGNE